MPVLLRKALHLAGCHRLDRWPTYRHSQKRSWHPDRPDSVVPLISYTTCEPVSRRALRLWIAVVCRVRDVLSRASEGWLKNTEVCDLLVHFRTYGLPVCRHPPSQPAGIAARPSWQAASPRASRVTDGCLSLIARLRLHSIPRRSE